MLLNDLFSTTLVGMGQQLAAISTGINDLPTNIAKALASTGTTPSAAPASSSSTFAAEIKLLPHLDRTKHPKVVHWDRRIYKLLRKKTRKDGRSEDDEDENDEDEDDDPQIVEASATAVHAKLTAKGISITSCYMENEDGEQMSESNKTAARSRARKFWTKLSNNGGTPPTSLGKADSDVRDAFVACMEGAFPWLRFCENHWKAEQIWINHYGSWLVSWKKSAGGGVAVKAEADADDESDEDGRKKAPKRPQQGGETSKSKRPRVDEKEPTPTPPHPAPIKITTERIRVRLFVLIDYIPY